MRAKYLEIPINTVVSSGTSELVVGTTASTPISTGTNSSLGEINVISAVGGGNTNYTPGTTVGVATTGGTGTSCTVDIVVNGGGAVTTITINAPGTGYVATDVLVITGGDANATFQVTSVGNLGSNGNIVNATGIGTGVLSGDVVYNVTAGTTGAVNLVIGPNEITCTTELFPLGGETAAVRKLNQLNAVSTFTARKVRVGDIVKNTTAVTQTTVATLINETSLTLTTDIFNSSTLYDDNFTIEPLTTEVYDNGKTFLSTVSVGDVYENTTLNFSEAVTQVIDNFRLGLSSTMGTIGNAYSIFDTSVA